MKNSWIQIYKKWCKFIYQIRGIEPSGDIFTFYKGIVVSIDEAIMLQKSERLLESSRRLRERINNEKLVDRNI